jgi:hypothetical protein
MMFDSNEVVVFSGTKEDADVAYTFCQGALHSMFGSDRGEDMFQTMPALVGFMMYAWALQNMGEA